MAKRLIVHDPYRNKDTTLTDFARAEGVKKDPVAHYYWLHRTLEGFRDRPAKWTGNGIKPHTYAHKGEYLTIEKASRLARMSCRIMQEYRERLGIDDIEAIRRAYDADLELKRMKHLFETDDGRKMTITEYARSQGVTAGAVSCWIHRKGNLKGFSKRGYSRVNPKLYTHDGLGMSKSAREWAEYFGCTKETVRKWLYNHGNDMTGFRTRKQSSMQSEYKGERKSLGEWARQLGVSYVRVYKYHERHGSLEGFRPERKRGREAKERQD